MAALEIPGYYYDIEKKKYFKISNGTVSVGHDYHNNTVQSRKRQKKHEISVPKNPPIGQEMKINIINLRLQLNLAVRDKSYLIFENIKRARDALQLKSPATRIFTMNNDYVIVQKGSTAIGLIKFQDFLNNDLRTQIIARDYQIEEFLTRLPLDCLKTKHPRVSALSFQHNILIRSTTIVDSDADNLGYNFIQVDRMDMRGTRTDLTSNFLQSILNLSYIPMKKRLFQMIGLDGVKTTDEVQDVLRRKFSDVSVTEIHTTEDYICIGSNFGDIFKLLLNSSGQVQKVFHFGLRRKEPVKIIRSMDHRIIMCTKSYLYVLTSTLLYEMKIAYHDTIKDVHVTSGQSLVIAGLTQVSIFQILPGGYQVKKLPYLNANVTNQYSGIIGNNLIINESNSKIQVYNLTFLQRFTFPLSIEKEARLKNIFIAEEEAIIFEYEISLRIKLMVYKI